MSSSFFGNLKRKFCKMVVKKRKSSILAKPSPKQKRFPEEESEEEHRERSLLPCLSPCAQLHSLGDKSPSAEARGIIVKDS